MAQVVCSSNNPFNGMNWHKLDTFKIVLFLLEVSNSITYWFFCNYHQILINLTHQEGGNNVLDTILPVVEVEVIGDEGNRNGRIDRGDDCNSGQGC